MGEGEHSELGYSGKTEEERVQYLVEATSRALTSVDPSLSAYAQLEATVKGLQLSSEPVTRGLIADLSAKDSRIAYEIQELYPPTTVEVLWALGECKERGIPLLHRLVLTHWQELEKFADSSQKTWVDERNSRISNLAMIRLAELHREGLYSDQQLAEVVDAIGKVVGKSIPLIEKVDYLPDQFGLETFWAEAYSSSSTNDKVWQISRQLFEEEMAIGNTLKRAEEEMAIRNTLKKAEYDRRIYFTHPLFRGINQAGINSGDRIRLLVDYVYQDRDFWDLNYLQPEVFLNYIDKCLVEKTREPYWRSGELGLLFSHEGVGSRFFDLITRNPDDFRKWYSRLYGCCNLMPKEEARVLMKKILGWRKSNNIVLGADEVFACVDSWEFAGPDVRRFLEWQVTYNGDLACVIMEGLSRYRETAPEELEKLEKLYDRDMRTPPLGQARSAGVWLPILGEKLFLSTIGDRRSISFAGNLIVEVQNVARRMTVSDALNRVLAAIHTHLHISEFESAAALVRGLYSVSSGEVAEFEGVTKADVEGLMANPEGRNSFALQPEGAALSEEEKASIWNTDY